MRILAAAAMVAVLALSGCSTGDDGSEGSSAEDDFRRTRPTDQLEHDHSSENSALAPETVQPSDVAALGDGVATGATGEFWVGINICGRFVELPPQLADGPMTLDGTGLLTLAPSPGEPSGLELTADSVLGMLDVQAETGTISFGESWAGSSVGEGDAAVPLAGRTFTTGDECAIGPKVEQGEVQLWYYTPAAVVSGEQVRMVVTDPGDTPLVEDGSAVTIAFAPLSSLPTLPPSALVG